MTKEKDKNINCEHCNEPLRDNIGYSQTGEMTYKIYSQNGEIEYEQDEFSAEDGGIYYCQNCGQEITNSEKEIIELIKI